MGLRYEDFAPATPPDDGLYDTPPHDAPADILAERRRSAGLFADLARQLADIEALARAMTAGAPAARPGRRPDGAEPFAGRIVARMSAAAEADVHRAATASGLTLAEFARRALAAAAHRTLRHAADRRTCAGGPAASLPHREGGGA